MEKEYIVTQEQLDDLDSFVKAFNLYHQKLLEVAMEYDWNDGKMGFALGNIHCELEQSSIKMSSLLEEIEFGRKDPHNNLTYIINSKEFGELRYFATEFKVNAEGIGRIPIDEWEPMGMGYTLGCIHSNLLHNHIDSEALLNNIKKNNKERKGEIGGIYLKDGGIYLKNKDGTEVCDNNGWQIYLRRSDVEKW